MTFANQVSQHIAKYERRINAVYRSSVQDVAELANVPRANGGRMPVDTGFLRASIRAAINATPGSSSDGVAGALARWQIGDSTTVGWSANYARFMEYRYGFMRGAAEKWSSIVDKNAAEAKRRL